VEAKKLNMDLCEVQQAVSQHWKKLSEPEPKPRKGAEQNR
jgi:hypothetical protein